MSDTKDVREKFKAINVKGPRKFHRLVERMVHEAQDLELGAISSRPNASREANKNTTILAMVFWMMEQSEATRAEVLRVGFDRLNAFLVSEAEALARKEAEAAATLPPLAKGVPGGPKEGRAATPPKSPRRPKGNVG